MRPLRVVVMGVAGAGKTTVGERLAARFGAVLVDADDAHPPEHVAKMAAGVPLTDDDRWPWLARLRDELAAHDRIVVTCSALRRAYRDRLREAGDVRFVHLVIEPADAERRLGARRDHFMGPAMVASQFAVLEPPGPDERDVTAVDAVGPLDEVVATALDAVAG